MDPGCSEEGMRPHSFSALAFGKDFAMVASDAFLPGRLSISLVLRMSSSSFIFGITF
jgi:hypothetical protein